MFASIRRTFSALGKITAALVTRKAKPTTIHKVEITVSSNQAPDQIARYVVQALSHQGRG